VLEDAAVEGDPVVALQEARLLVIEDLLKFHTTSGQQRSLDSRVGRRRSR
jgi:hypothetical protein